jgi:hypothetical protein
MEGMVWQKIDKSNLVTKALTPTIFSEFKKKNPFKFYWGGGTSKR